MRGTLISVAAVVVALTPIVARDAPVEFKESMLVSGDVSKPPRIEYPYEARRQRLEGSGVFILNVDSKSGRVESIQIKKSTGHRLLDVACLQGLINSRLKPGTPAKLWVPITFSMKRPVGPRTR